MLFNLFTSFTYSNRPKADFDFWMVQNRNVKKTDPAILVTRLRQRLDLLVHSMHKFWNLLFEFLYKRQTNSRFCRCQCRRISEHASSSTQFIPWISRHRLLAFRFHSQCNLWQVQLPSSIGQIHSLKYLHPHMGFIGHNWYVMVFWDRCREF